jgi:hypothetical protein
VPLPTFERSKARKLEKESEAARLYFEEQMKPSRIAAKLRMDVKRVYKLIEYVKIDTKKVLSKIEEGRGALPTNAAKLELDVLKALNEIDQAKRERKRDCKR